MHRINALFKISDSFPVENILKYITIQYTFIHTLALNLYQFLEYARGLVIFDAWRFVRLVTYGTNERLSIFPTEIIKTFCRE